MARRRNIWRRINARLPEITIAIAIGAVVLTALWIAWLFRQPS